MSTSPNQSLITASNRKWIIAGVVAATVVVGISAVYFTRSSKQKKSNKKPRNARHRKMNKNQGQDLSPSSSSDFDSNAPEQAALTPLPPSPGKSLDMPMDSITSLDPAEFDLLIASWSASEKQKFAQKLKAKGNDLYKNGQFADAVSFYSRSILLQPESSIFWCNRAACYANLNQPMLVIEDCTKALALDPTYGKALHRRAIAYEQTESLRDALNDYAVMTILDGYKNTSAMSASERIVKQLAEMDARKLFVNKVPALPSSTFIQAYIESFRPVTCPALESVKNTMQSNSAAHFLQCALNDIAVRKYENADDNVLKAVRVLEKTTDGVTENEIMAYIYNLAGTFYFLKGQVDLAAEYFEKSLQLDDKNINTLNPTSHSLAFKVKCSNLLMEKGDHKATLETFDKALEISTANPDIYYHRGQVKFLLNEFTEAVADYQKSIDLDPKFHPAYIQLGVSQYKLGSIQLAMATFKKAMSLFPRNAEVFNYYSELLQDQGRFEEAKQHYDRAIEYAPSQPMPYVNKALLMFQVFQDPPAAESLLRKALEYDPKADLVLVQLANFLLPQAKVDEAMECFDKAISLARTEPELINILMAKESGLAQFHVLRTIPSDVIAQQFKQQQ